MKESTLDNADLFAAYGVAAMRFRQIEEDARKAAEFFERRAKEVPNDAD